MKFVFAFLFVLQNYLAQTQCTLNDIFVLDLGVSKFQAMNKLNSNKNIYDAYVFTTYWEYPSYLKGDSVLTSLISYKQKIISCFIGSENNFDGALVFSDDKLYKMSITANYSGSSFSICQDNYRKLITYFGKKFPDTDDFQIINSTTKEQVGEGIIFAESKIRRLTAKPKYVVIEYDLKYEYDQHGNSLNSGKIDHYELSISFLDYSITKLIAD